MFDISTLIELDREYKASVTAMGEAYRSREPLPIAINGLSGAALDAYVPEPVSGDHPLVELAREFPDRLVLCPHQGGLTQESFQNVYRMLFENLAALMEGRRPERIVNGL